MSPPASTTPSLPLWRGLSPGEQALCALLCLILFFAPIKFGTNIGQNSISAPPLDLNSFINMGWPWQWLTIAAALAAMACLILYPHRFAEERRRLLAAWPWLALLLAGITTWSYTQDRVFYWQYCLLLASAFCVATASALLVQYRPQTLWLLGTAAAAGLGMSLGSGVYQYLWGLQDTVDHIHAAGGSLRPELLQRLQQRQIFANFVYPNAFAAHILLVTPPVCAGLWLLGAKQDRQRWIYRILAVAIASVAATALYWTGCKGAWAALPAGLAVVWALRRPDWRHATLACLCLALLGIAAIYLMRHNPSLLIRGEYHRVMGSILAVDWRGCGLGDFAAEYLARKKPGYEDVVLPHAFCAGFITQCGIAGLLAMAFFCAAVIALLRRLCLRGSALACAAAWGAATWMIHAQVDFNDAIPGSLVSFAILLGLAQQVPGPGGVPKPAQNLHRISSAGINTLILLVALLSLGSLRMIAADYDSARLERELYGDQASRDLHRFVPEYTVEGRCTFCHEPLPPDAKTPCRFCSARRLLSLEEAREISVQALQLARSHRNTLPLMVAADRLNVTLDELEALNRSGRHRSSAIEMELIMLQRLRLLETIVSSRDATHGARLDLLHLRLKLGQPPELIRKEILQAERAAPASNSLQQIKAELALRCLQLGIEPALNQMSLMEARLQMLAIETGALDFDRLCGRSLDEKRLQWISARMHELSQSLAQLQNTQVEDEPRLQALLRKSAAIQAGLRNLAP